MIKKIANKLNVPIQTHFCATSIDVKARRVTFENGRAEHYRKLITTIPLNNLLNMVQTPTSSTVKHAASKLLHTSVLNINLGLNCSLPRNEHWIYFPEKKFPFYRVGCWHNVSPSLVKTGATALYAEIAYRNEQKPCLEPMTIDGINVLLKHFNINTNAIITQKNLLLTHAYVIYDTCRKQNLAKLLTNLEQQSIHSVGRFGAWKYDSMQEAILDGKQTAVTLLQQIHSPVIPSKSLSL
jgi:protoporphyrinogen oxidase